MAEIDEVMVASGYEDGGTEPQHVEIETITPRQTGNVAGVKGDAESFYRNGYVNISYSDIGTVPIENGGTGATNAHDAANAILDGVNTSLPLEQVTDDDIFVMNHNGEYGWFYKTFDYVWSYIKGKIGISTTGDTYLKKDGTWGTVPNFDSSTDGIVTSGGSYNANKTLFNDNTWGWVENMTADFSSGDTTDASATSWTSVSKVTSGSSLSTLFNRISTMMKNTRYLYSRIQTHDTQITNLEENKQLKLLVKTFTNSAGTGDINTGINIDKVISATMGNWGAGSCHVVQTNSICHVLLYNSGATTRMTDTRIVIRVIYFQ